MKEVKTNFWTKAKRFIKKNAYVLSVAGCAILLVVALVVTATVRGKNADFDINDANNYYEEESTMVSASSTIDIVVPVKGEYTVGYSFVEDNHIYYPSVNEYTTHLAVDFITNESIPVIACMDGTIEKVDYSSLDGSYVVINHGNNYKSVYKSLAQENLPKVGDKVKSGDVIGKTSASMGYEANLGIHLHFELLENDKNINPMQFLEDK